MWWTVWVPFRKEVSAQAHQMPTLPNYGEGGIAGIIPDILGPGAGWSGVGAKQVAVLVIDGLGWNQLQSRLGLAPTMAKMDAQKITSVAPTTTAAALTSITTGLSPAEHGLLGYRIDVGGSIMNVLRWGDKQGDLRGAHPPRQMQPCPPFLGSRVPVISKSEFAETGFTLAHLWGVNHVGWRSPSAIAVEIGKQLREGHNFVYAYYDGIDKVAHERGFGVYFDAELVATDRLIADVISAMPTGSQLLVTADHGQVHVGDSIVHLDSDVLALVHHQSGEGRFRWLHAKSGCAAELLDVCQRYADLAWVRTKQQIIDDRWLGESMPSIHSSRLGDVALVARTPITFDDPDENGPFTLICRHGSLTPDEMLVPLLSAVA